MTAAGTDLAAVAGRLGRAANRIEAFTAALPADRRWEAFTPGSEGWDVRESAPTGARQRVRTVARLRQGGWNEDAAACQMMAGFDPYTAAALVPALRLAASWSRIGYWVNDAERRMITYLDVFARRLLGEEEHGD